MSLLNLVRFYRIHFFFPELPCKCNVNIQCMKILCKSSGTPELPCKCNVNILRMKILCKCNVNIRL